jgi:hypothetical protein
MMKTVLKRAEKVTIDPLLGAVGTGALGLRGALGAVGIEVVGLPDGLAVVGEAPPVGAAVGGAVVGGAVVGAGVGGAVVGGGAVGAGTNPWQKYCIDEVGVTGATGLNGGTGIGV